MAVNPAHMLTQRLRRDNGCCSSQNQQSLTMGTKLLPQTLLPINNCKNNSNM